MIKPEQITDEMVKQVTQDVGVVQWWTWAPPAEIIAAAANVVLRHLGIEADLGSSLSGVKDTNGITDKRISFEELKKVREAMPHDDEDVYHL